MSFPINENYIRTIFLLSFHKQEEEKESEALEVSFSSSSAKKRKASGNICPIPCKKKKTIEKGDLFEERRLLLLKRIETLSLKIRQFDFNAKVFYERSLCYYAIEKFDEAEHDIKSASRLEDSNLEIANLYAKILLKKKEHFGALTQIKKAVSLSISKGGDTGLYFANLALIYCRNKHYYLSFIITEFIRKNMVLSEEALKIIALTEAELFEKTSLRKLPQKKPSNNFKGVLDYAAGTKQLSECLFSKAKESFKKSLKANNQNWMGWFMLAEIAFYQNKRNKSRKFVNLSLCHNPNNYIALSRLGDLLNSDGLAEEGQMLLNKSLEICPNYSYSLTKRGEEYRKCKQYELAILDFNKALDLLESQKNISEQAHEESSYLMSSLDKQILFVLTRLSLTYIQSKNHIKALEYTIKAIERRFESALLFMLHGVCLGKLTEFENAILFIKKAISMTFDNDHRPYFELGEIYFQLKNFDLALENFLTAYKFNPTNFSNLLRIAEVHQKLNQWEQSLHFIGKAQFINPKHIRLNIIYAIVMNKIGNATQSQEIMANLFKDPSSKNLEKIDKISHYLGIELFEDMGGLRLKKMDGHF